MPYHTTSSCATKNFIIALSQSPSKSSLSYLKRFYNQLRTLAEFRAPPWAKNSTLSWLSFFQYFRCFFPSYQTDPSDSAYDQSLHTQSSSTEALTSFSFLVTLKTVHASFRALTHILKVAALIHFSLEPSPAAPSFLMIHLLKLDNRIIQLNSRDLTCRQNHRKSSHKLSNFAATYCLDLILNLTKTQITSHTLESKPLPWYFNRQFNVDSTSQGVPQNPESISSIVVLQPNLKTKLHALTRKRFNRNTCGAKLTISQILLWLQRDHSVSLQDLSLERCFHDSGLPESCS